MFALQTTQASAAPSFHVLQYKYVPDILEKRTPFREAHLSKAGEKVPFLAVACGHQYIDRREV